jgi:hypothetical protein
MVARSNVLHYYGESFLKTAIEKIGGDQDSQRQ